MLDKYFNLAPDEDEDDFYPDFYYSWDAALSKAVNPGYLEVEEILEIIEIYLHDNDIKKAKKTIGYAFNIYPDNETLIYETLLLLNDYELWNDLLNLTEQHKNSTEVWVDGHRVTALLHLGMEEDAFLAFSKMKTKYANQSENLSIIYQAMAEALYEVDLFEASIDVTKEVITLLGNQLDFYWLLLQNHLALGEKEKVFELADKIAQLNSFDAQSWYRLGLVFKEMEEDDKAIDAFEFSENLGNKSNDLVANMLALYQKNSNHIKTLEKAKEYLLLYPEMNVAFLMAASACAHMERWEEAIGFIDKLLKITPFNEDLYLFKSSFLLNSDELRKAKLTIQLGIEKSGDPSGKLRKELDRLEEEFPGESN